MTIFSAESQPPHLVELLSLATPQSLLTSSELTPSWREAAEWLDLLLAL